MLNLELDILDTVECTNTLVVVGAQLTGGRKAPYFFNFFVKKCLTSTQKCGKIVSPQATGAAGVFYYTTLQHICQEKNKKFFLLFFFLKRLDNITIVQYNEYTR